MPTKTDPSREALEESTSLRARNAEIARRIMPVATAEAAIVQPPEGVFVLAWSGGDERFIGRYWTKMLTIDSDDDIRLYLEYRYEIGQTGWMEQPTCIAEIAGYLWGIGGIGYLLEKNHENGSRNNQVDRKQAPEGKAKGR